MSLSGRRMLATAQACQASWQTRVKDAQGLAIKALRATAQATSKNSGVGPETAGEQSADASEDQKWQKAVEMKNGVAALAGGRSRRQPKYPSPRTDD